MEIKDLDVIELNGNKYYTLKIKKNHKLKFKDNEGLETKFVDEPIAFDNKHAIEYTGGTEYRILPLSATGHDPLLAQPITFESIDGSAQFVYLSINGNAIKNEYEVSYDKGKTWEQYNLGSNIIINTEHPTVSFRCKSMNLNGATPGPQTGPRINVGYVGDDGQSNVKVSGNIMSMLPNFDPYADEYELINEYEFGWLFADCQIIDASKLRLPATKLTRSCYESMFANCAKLVSAPEVLPAMQLTRSCYESMFYFCDSLVNPVKELPAEVIETNSYSSMFSCTNLENMPIIKAKEIKSQGCSQMFRECNKLAVVTSLDDLELIGDQGCSQMFKLCGAMKVAPAMSNVKSVGKQGCNEMFAEAASLEEAPELLATEIDESCYMCMFENCDKLVKAPSILPAMKLAESCYNGMFKRCSSLQKAPKLPATELVAGANVTSGCYSSMFAMCYHLNEVYCNAENFSDNTSGAWISSVSEIGTIYMNPAAAYIGENADTSFCPPGWLRKNYDGSDILG